MELKENHHNSNNSNKSKRIIIKEEIDEGVVEAIVEIVAVVVEMGVATETETTRTTTIIMVMEIVEMVVALRKRNVEDVIGEEIEKQVHKFGQELQDFVERVVPSSSKAKDFRPEADLIVSEKSLSIVMDLPGLTKKEIAN